MTLKATGNNAKQEVIALALGDPAGIGAEVTLKSLAALQARGTAVNVVLVGCRRWLERTYMELRDRSAAPLADPGDYPILDRPLQEGIVPGQGTAASGAASFAWLNAAVDLVLSGQARSLTTAPIAKHAWHAAGHRYPGQTERLAELCGRKQASMLFTARSPGGRWRLNTLLATTHIPLAEVPQALTPALVEHQLEMLLDFCRRFQPEPSLTVAGLNPHAGEGGQLGMEEQDWLIPLLEGDGEGTTSAGQLLAGGGRGLAWRWSGS
jgi:4-hydroxythreonine-4-phosphate dehydrogenase